MVFFCCVFFLFVCLVRCAGSLAQPTLTEGKPECITGGFQVFPQIICDAGDFIMNAIGEITGTSRENSEESCVTPWCWFGVGLVSFTHIQMCKCVPENQLPFGNRSWARFLPSVPACLLSSLVTCPTMAAVAISKPGWRNAVQKGLHRLRADLPEFCASAVRSPCLNGADLVVLTKAKINRSQIWPFVRVSVRTTRTVVVV